MPFYHGKNGRLWFDQYEMTNYFTEFTAGARAGTAETTVFGRGAKTFIGGLNEGQITARGFFDDSTTGSDQELSAQLGNATNTAITFSPSGKTVMATRAILSEAAETDYTITTPSNNVVGVNATFQADSGLKTGLILVDPTTTYTTIGNVNGYGGFVAAGSNGVNTNSFTGSGVLNVVDTTASSPAGTLLVDTGTSVAYMSYTGTTPTSFTGVTTLYGGGVLATGGNVHEGTNGRNLDAGQTTTNGLVAVAHILTLTGTGSPGVRVQLDHSDDGNVWATLIILTNGPTGTIVQQTPEAVYGVVNANVPINRFLRGHVITTGSTISTTVLVSAARM